MVDQTTRKRILEATERIFAEKGYAAMTLREVTEAAGVNLAAVNYHFGSKEGLLTGMIERRVGPINEKRMALFEEARAAYGEGPIPLERIWQIIMEPLAEALETESGYDVGFLRMIARSITEPSDFIQQTNNRFFRDLKEVAIREVYRNFPELGMEAVAYRIYLASSTMTGMIVQHERMTLELLALVDLSDIRKLFDEMVRFVCAGMREQLQTAARIAAKTGEDQGCMS